MPHSIIRVLSKQGFCSRKQAVGLVKSGKVRVSGQVVRDPGAKISDDAKLTVSGGLASKKRDIYIMLHKPAGYVTTRSDERGRPTVYHFLKDIKEWIFPVGRLDKDTEGLLIFTNDTNFGERLTNPVCGIQRTYRARLDGCLTDEDIAAIEEGADIGKGDICRPAKVAIISTEKHGQTVEITLTEGKNREVRRIFEALGKPVKHLLRIRFGPYKLGSLKPGEWRMFNR